MKTLLIWSVEPLHYLIQNNIPFILPSAKQRDEDAEDFIKRVGPNTDALVLPLNIMMNTIETHVIEITLLEKTIIETYNKVMPSNSIYFISDKGLSLMESGSLGQLTSGEWYVFPVLKTSSVEYRPLSILL